MLPGHPTPTVTRFGLLLASAVLTLLSGCLQYPMGLSKEQWEALPPARQAELSAQQAQIDEARAARDAALALESARLERERLRAAYAQASYGDIITVNIHDGMVAFYGKRHPYLPVTFELVRGETKAVEFVRAGRPQERREVVMRFTADGEWFIFDDPAPKRVKLKNEGWDRGRTYTPPAIGSHDGDSEAIDIRIDIRLKRLPARSRSRIERDSSPVHYP